MSKRIRLVAVVVAAVVVVVLVYRSRQTTSVSSSLKPSPPSAGSPSSKYSLPLPNHSKAEPGSTSPGGEAYRVMSKATLADINAFYVKHTDGKPFKSFDWCGTATFSSTHLVRIWQKPPGTDQLIVDLATEPAGVLISVREDTAAIPSACPPAAPDAGQPFEGPGIGGSGN